MNTRDEMASDDEETASLWAARLDGGALSDQDRAALEAWLAGDPGRRAVLARYCQISVDLDGALPELLAEGRVEIPGEESASADRRPVRWIVAGLLAAAAAAALILWAGSWGRPSERMSAVSGQTRTFALADGSRVELNANTSITVENGRSERRVRLANGEAFFEVSKDKARPFIVETPAGLVRVTGTKFDVRTLSVSQLEVTVLEGQVQVRPGSSGADPVTIGPGDQLCVEEGGVKLRGLSSEGLQDELAWREGWVVCRGMAVSELIDRVARYHGRTITVSRGAATVLIGGRFTLGDLDEFFRDLEQAAPGLQVVASPGQGARVRLRGEN